MQNEPLVASIVSILLNTFQGDADHPQLESYRQALSAQVERFVRRQQPLQLLLPGFPLKSPNTRDKTASDRPDYAEYAALERLDQLCRAVGRVYPAGCALELFSDGLSFHDLLDIPRDTANDYHRRLRALYASPVLRWHDYASVQPGFDRQRDRAESVLRRYLPAAAADFSQPLPENQAGRQPQWLDLLREDNAARGIAEAEDWPRRALRLAWRGIALDAMLAEHFPEAIRLTIHPSGAPGGKFLIRLSPAQAEAALPWHRVYLLNLAGRGELVSKRQALDARRAKAVSFDGQPWLYLEQAGAEWEGCELSVMLAGRFGLLIENRRPGANCLSLPRPALTRLAQLFGFVALRGFAVEDEDNLIDFSAQFGTPYIWQFGAVHKVKPEEDADGFVHSFEELPLHWDLSMLPADNKFVRKNPRFSASLFALYCKTAPQHGEGQTTLVDARNILRQVPTATLAEWERLQIRYHTKFTYFGGDARVYPLVETHPDTGEAVLRFQENSNSELQKFFVDVEERADDCPNLVQELLERAYAPENLIEHDWHDGDLVLIDNYNSLHGRRAMTRASRGRELWRVQVHKGQEPVQRLASKGEIVNTF